MKCCLVLLLMVLPAIAQAQVHTNWEVTAIAGILGGRGPEPSAQQYRDNWFQTGLGGLLVGRYLTSHLKLEVEGSGTGEGTRYLQRNVMLPGYPGLYPITSEVHTSVKSVATTVAWQFFENEWLHPFVQAGVSVDFDRRTVYTWPQQYYTGDPSRGGERVDIPGGVDGPHHTRALRAVVAGGVKMYVSPRLFLRADGRASAGQTRQHVAFRVGFGAEF